MEKPPSHPAAVLQAIASNLVIEERKTPLPGPGDILVRNHAIAINPVDWKRQAWGVLIPSFPVILGADISGTVVKVGESVTAFKPGDRVLGFADAFATHNHDRAAFQEYTVISATSTALLPENITFKQGATLPTAVATASMALFDVLGLPREAAENSGTSVLIWGGGSSVGSMAIQLARLAGLKVYAAASERQHKRLRGLGSSFLVDYSSPTAAADVISAADRAGDDIAFAVDAISTADSLAPVVGVVSKSTSPKKKIARTLGAWPEGVVLPDGVETQHILGNEFTSRRVDLSVWMCHDVLPKWLERGELVPQEQNVVGGGVGALQRGLDVLKEGAGSEKAVVEL
ncbi:related to oxidoreductase [Cephalotrichum gorgonifer]|uniref:Related to oxidoreductase n=1 Tax=Cephalotrichum gorgonifer TaxID=2041049 RepID=A0AAE8SQT5_9PEZI|nr:related to oxidoreductase [Cephalotrichum gorgonifer]